MGMYDNVLFTVLCPHCDELIDGFQTKDRENALDTVGPEGLDSFYSECRSCLTWVDYRWDEETGKAVLNFEKMFHDQAASIRLLRSQLFALCKRLHIRPAELHKFREDTDVLQVGRRSEDHDISER